MKPGVTRRLHEDELPPSPPGELVIGFAYDSPGDRDRFAAANRRKHGHRVVPVTLADGSVASYVFMRLAER